MPSSQTVTVLLLISTHRLTNDRIHENATSKSTRRHSAAVGLTEKVMPPFPVAAGCAVASMWFSLWKGSDFFHTDVVRRLRTGDGVKMTENEAMEEKTAQMLHAPLVGDERWVEGALGSPSSCHRGEMLANGVERVNVGRTQFVETLLTL